MRKSQAAKDVRVREGNKKGKLTGKTHPDYKDRYEVKFDNGGVAFMKLCCLTLDR